MLSAFFFLNYYQSSGNQDSMDLWIVAAATGAGYIAKHWQQNLLSRENDDSSGSFQSSFDGQPQLVNVFRQITEQPGPLHRLSGKKVGKSEEILGKNFQELIQHRSDAAGEAGPTASTSHDYHNLFSLDRLDVVREHERVRSWGSHDRNTDSDEGYSLHRFNRINRHSMMMPQLYSLQPLRTFDPSEFYSGHAGIEPAVRPSLVTEGIRPTSRAGGGFDIGVKNHEELPRSTLPSLPSRPSISGKMAPARLVNTEGSSDGILFFLGLMIGMLSSSVTSRTEMDKLNENLKQAKNLVKDLHEELEMKDQLTVKEIDWKPSSAESSGRNGMPRDCAASDHEADESKQNMEKSEAMRKIEAELEAELEMLEMNMKISSLENISEFVELAPDLEIVRQDLNLEKIGGQPDGARSSSNIDTSETSDHIPWTANYVVSPRELTLRLHEVIESRLEARILELEAALESTQRRLSALSRNMRSGSIDEPERSQNRGSLSLVDGSNGTELPFSMNLSEEALDAYNDASEWTPISRESSEEAVDEELTKRLVEHILRKQGKIQEQVL